MPESDATKIPVIAIHGILLRQTPDSIFSHFTGSPDELIQLVKNSFGKQRSGNFKGSLVITVPSNGNFFAKITKENVRDGIEKPEAESVKIVLHSRERLETADKETLPKGVDWAIVSINAYP